jgi:hypothetical protein
MELNSSSVKTEHACVSSAATAVVGCVATDGLVNAAVDTGAMAGEARNNFQISSLGGMNSFGGLYMLSCVMLSCVLCVVFSKKNNSVNWLYYVFLDVLL